MADLQTSTWSETAASNNTAAPDGWPENMSYASVNDAAREMMGAIKREYNRAHATVTNGGTTANLTISYAAAPNTYTQGLQFAFRSTLINLASCTLNVNALGAKTIKKPSTTGLANLATGDIYPGQIVVVQYDASADAFLMLTPASLLTAAEVEYFEVAASDETTVIVAGTNKIAKRVRYAATLTAVYAELKTAATSGTFTVDINKNGTTMLSTKLTFDATERDTATAAVAAVISVTSIAQHDEITIDVDDAGGGSPAGLKVSLVLTR